MYDDLCEIVGRGCCVVDETVGVAISCLICDGCGGGIGVGRCSIYNWNIGVIVCKIYDELSSIAGNIGGDCELKVHGIRGAYLLAASCSIVILSA